MHVTEGFLNANELEEAPYHAIDVLIGGDEDRRNRVREIAGTALIHAAKMGAVVSIVVTFYGSNKSSDAAAMYFGIGMGGMMISGAAWLFGKYITNWRV